jgi:hypothetical protein
MHKESLDDSTIVFESFFFLSFRACIEGFKYYKPLINIDDTYLYGWYDEK